ncbi:GMC family oxidoreductase [Marinibactrum halimedae]|uniref:Choline oxidase n=1 Tax=Marinibactrum halimedae TaxID=1444977 RepID=A0AA37WNL4_9GAMM|nr:GMC oxidoreductase [Marinibactrum halimedae]MCD9459535.1 GMC oxidoreductase [Marinibactrum halimedae]GLS28189.1 choline oxidase [Marinibactrum halimedae]
MGDQKSKENNPIENNNAASNTKASESAQTKKGGMDRRTFSKRAIQLGGLAAASSSVAASSFSTMQSNTFYDEYEYVIVGSGAGGGPLAANLAKAGYSVLVLEAGDNDPSDNTHDIPAWHPFASEDRKLSWDFFVNHYKDPQRQQQDSKYVPGKGILYPRSSTVGGCTTHHALITVYPHNNDFDKIAELTGDDSWDSANMRRYFERLERCEYVPRPLSANNNPSRHGFDGWLPTNKVDLGLLLEDPAILKIVLATLSRYGLDGALDRILSGNLALDINHWDVARGREGPFLVPMAANGRGRRESVREYLFDTQDKYPDRLHIRTNALATQVLFDGNRAIGVEFIEGQGLYRADPLHNNNANAGERKQVIARREVILAGGAFNSPQLLKLSGIGPADELRRHGITPRLNRPGVGENLQDRYEVGVVSELDDDLALLERCTWGEEGDPCLRRYRNRWWSRGPYATNGATLSVVKRSFEERLDPDLFIFGLPSEFRGYYPGYSESLKTVKNRFSWLVLKGHTNNSAGRVTLRSSDPQDTPEINFNYFDEGNDTNGDDLRSVVEGVKAARDIMDSSWTRDQITREVYPGDDKQSDQEIEEYVKNEAWGHHASCTNKMGSPEDPMAVVDSKFRVIGTENLRVVDASVFPYIPGFFIVVPIYMISEKASDEIIATAQGTTV